MSPSKRKTAQCVTVHSSFHTEDSIAGEQFEQQTITSNFDSIRNALPDILLDGGFTSRSVHVCTLLITLQAAPV